MTSDIFNFIFWKREFVWFVMKTISTLHIFMISSISIRCLQFIETIRKDLTIYEQIMNKLFLYYGISEF